MRGPSVRIIDWSTFTICAMLAIRTRSAWRMNMWKLVAATSASRRVLSWRRAVELGAASYHVPHSSTASATFLSGSLRSMIAECLAMNSSSRRVWAKVDSHSVLGKPTALPLCDQSPVGIV
jgi:hypothetical protein